MLADEPGVARGKKILKKCFFFKFEKHIFYFFLAYTTPRPPMSVLKRFRPIGPAVWPAIGKIYIYSNVLFYYIDIVFLLPVYTLTFSFIYIL